MTDFQKAMEKIGQVAMGDLIGCSEAPGGVPDNYPFNAIKWVEALPEEWRRDGERVMVHVYHHEEIPQFSIVQ